MAGAITTVGSWGALRGTKLRPPNSVRPFLSCLQSKWWGESRRCLLSLRMGRLERREGEKKSRGGREEGRKGGKEGGSGRRSGGK